MRCEVARRQRRYEDALAELETAAVRFAALGQRIVVASCRLFAARVLQEKGEVERALATLRDADAILADLGERGLRSTAQGELARLAVAVGDRDLARKALATAAELCDPADLFSNIAIAAAEVDLALAESRTADAVRAGQRIAGLGQGVRDITARLLVDLSAARVHAAQGERTKAREILLGLAEFERSIGDESLADITADQLRALGV